MGDWHADQPTGEKIIGFLFPVPSMLMPQHYTNEYENVLITIDADGKVTKVSRQLQQRTPKRGRSSSTKSWAIRSISPKSP